MKAETTYLSILSKQEQVKHGFAIIWIVFHGKETVLKEQ